MKGVTWLAFGLMLSLLLVGVASFGSHLFLPSSFPSAQNLEDLSHGSITVLKQVDQLAAVTSTWDIVANLLSPITDQVKNLWSRFVEFWRSLFPSSQEELTTDVPPELREKIRQELLAELKDQGLLSVDILVNDLAGTKYGVMVIPSSGSISRDEWLKKSLSQMFADQVDLKFDETGMSGVVTPIFRDGRRGGDYVFVLTPLR